LHSGEQLPVRALPTPEGEMVGALATQNMTAGLVASSVTIVGMADATLKADLLVALPALIKVTGKGKLAIDAVGKLANSFTDVAGDVGACTLEIGAAAGTFVAAASASAQASVSVSVSFSASASVTGSAGA